MVANGDEVSIVTTRCVPEVVNGDREALCRIWDEVNDVQVGGLPRDEGLVCISNPALFSFEQEPNWLFSTVVEETADVSVEVRVLHRRAIVCTPTRTERPPAVLPAKDSESDSSTGRRSARRHGEERRGGGR